MKSKKWSKTPSAAEIAAFNGMHCKKQYLDALRSGWRCPCCRRSAQELIRWSEIKGPAWRAAYADEYGMGWTITLARHHCHGRGRFEETQVCGDCNSADGAVKRKLKLPARWSFAPHEIAQFVRGKPHEGVTIDYNKAKAIYDRGTMFFGPED